MEQHPGASWGGGGYFRDQMWLFTLSFRFMAAVRGSFRGQVGYLFTPVGLFTPSFRFRAAVYVCGGTLGVRWGYLLRHSISGWQYGAAPWCVCGVILRVRWGYSPRHYVSGRQYGAAPWCVYGGVLWGSGGVIHPVITFQGGSMEQHPGVCVGV